MFDPELPEGHVPRLTPRAPSSRPDHFAMDDEGPSSSRPYEVGYGKPPRQHQFQKGRSGNPKGRPRQRKTLPEIIADTLMHEVTVTTRSGRKRMPAAQALVHKLCATAMGGGSGSMAAHKLLFDLAKTYPLVEDALDGSDDGQTDADMAALAAYNAKVMSGFNAAAGMGSPGGLS